MQYFWDHTDVIKSKIKKSNQLALFLDFDGTLSPLAAHPDSAKLPEYTKQLLVELRNKGLYLHIISGRTLDDVKSHLDLSGISYSGNHGMEWEYNNRRFTKQVSHKKLQLLQTIKSDMQKISDNYAGTVVEDKVYSVAFHYRQVPVDKKPEIENYLQQTFVVHLQSNQVSLLFCKDTYDIRVNTNWNKGHIVQHFIKQSTFAEEDTIYIGDSKTDEDAFCMLADSITIKVGHIEDTRAKFFLTDEVDVQKFLSWLLSIRK